MGIILWGRQEKVFSIAEDQGNKRHHFFLILVSYTLTMNQTAKTILKTLAYDFSGQYFSRAWDWSAEEGIEML